MYEMRDGMVCRLYLDVEKVGLCYYVYPKYLDIDR